MRTCGTTATTTSFSEAHDVVQDVTNQKAPQDDEGEDQGQRGRHSGRFCGSLLSPTNPIGRQQRQSNGSEMLLDVKETERRPMASELQIGPDVDAEAQVDDSAKHRGN